MTGHPPHILLIVADDLSARDLGVYRLRRDAQPTPHLEQVAARGALFRHAWITPACRPSRAALMTGWYGPKTGYLSNKARPRPGTIAALGTIGHALQSLGYRTAIAGKWQHDPTPGECGFDEHIIWKRWEGYDGPVEGRDAPRRGRPARYWHPALVENGVGVPTGPDDYGPDLLARWTVDFLRRNRDAPAFVLHNELLTHVAWHFELGEEGYIPTPGEDRARLGSLASNVAYFDQLVGRMTNEIENEGLKSLTIVTSDNGSLGWGKYVLRKQRGPRIMLLAAGEGVRPGERRQLVDGSDLYASMREVAGGNGGMRDGLSFAPTLRDPAHVGREWAYSWLDEHDLVRTRRWLLDGEGNHFWRDPGGPFLPAPDTPEARRSREHLEKIAATIRSSSLTS